MIRSSGQMKIPGLNRAELSWTAHIGLWENSGLSKGSPHRYSGVIRYTNTDLRQWSPGAWALCCHCEDSGDAQSNPSWGRIHVDPEGDPGQNDDEQRGDVHLDQVVAHLTLQVEPHLNTSKFTCNKAETHIYYNIHLLLLLIIIENYYRNN